MGPGNPGTTLRGVSVYLAVYATKGGKGDLQCNRGENGLSTLKLYCPCFPKLYGPSPKQGWPEVRCQFRPQEQTGLRGFYCVSGSHFKLRFGSDAAKCLAAACNLRP
eukprot:3939084-Rhodomonas_salina.2